MKVTYCDVCGEVLKENESLFLVGINATTVCNISSTETYFNPPQNVGYQQIQNSNVRLHYFCITCKTILDGLLYANRLEVEKLKKQLTELMAKKAAKEKVKTKENK